MKTGGIHQSCRPSLQTCYGSAAQHSGGNLDWSLWIPLACSGLILLPYSDWPSPDSRPQTCRLIFNINSRNDCSTVSYTDSFCISIVIQSGTAMISVILQVIAVVLVALLVTVVVLLILLVTAEVLVILLVSV